METKLCCFLLALQIALGLVSATSRTFAPNDGVVTVSQPGTSNIGFKQNGGGKVNEEEAYGRIGSSPPRCDHKCYGCSPCEAIQVPSTSKRQSHMGINYANYEPEGWKCKCGPSFYTP